MAWQDYLNENRKGKSTSGSYKAGDWKNWLDEYNKEKNKSSSKLKEDDIFVDSPTYTTPKISTPSTPKITIAPTSPVTKAMTDNLFTPKVPKISTGTITHTPETAPIPETAPTTKQKLSLGNATKKMQAFNDFQDKNRANAWAGIEDIPSTVAKGVQMVAKPLNDLSNTILKSLGITPDNKVYNAIDNTQKYLGAKSDERARKLDENANAGEQLWNTTVRALPNILVTGEVGAGLKIAELPAEAGKIAKLTNEIKGLVPFMTTAFGSYARDEEKKGGDYNKQLVYGGIGAATEGGSELLAMPSWFRKILKGGGKDLVSAGAENVATSYGKVGLNFLKDLAKEGGQEALVDPIMNETGNLLNGTNDSLLQGTGQDFLGGVMMSAMLGSLGLPAELHNVRAYKIAKKSMDTKIPPTLEEVKAMEEDLSHIGNIVENSTTQKAQMQGIGEVAIGEDLGDSVEVKTEDGQVFNIRKAIFNNADVIPSEVNSEQLPEFSYNENQDILPSQENLPNEDILPNQDIQASKELLSREENKVSKDILYSEDSEGNEGNKANKDIKESNIKSVPIRSINVDPSRFQFKGETNAEGVTNQFKGGETFKKEMAGVVTLWNDKNNKLWVVNGHHRLEFAKRSNVKNLNAQIFNEADGWSAKDMRTLGAKINIADGKGTSIDSAKIFRENKMSLEDLKKEGLSLSEGKVKNGYYLSKLNSNLFNKVISRELTENKAVIIGKELTDEASQNAVYNLLNTYAKKGKTISDEVFKEIIETAKASETSSVKQATLFGLETMKKSNMVERGEIIAQVKKLLGNEKRLFENLTNSKKAELIKRAGNKLSDKKNISNKELVEQTLKLVDGYKNSKGTPISDVFSKYAKLYAEKKMSKSEAVEGAFSEIKALIKGGNYFVKEHDRNTKGSTNLPRPRQLSKNDREKKNGNKEESSTNAESELEKARSEVSAAKRNDVSAEVINHKNFETEHFRGTKYDWGLEVVAKRREGGYVNKSNPNYIKVDKHKHNIPAISTTFKILTSKISDVEVENWKKTVNGMYNINPEEKADLIKIINIYAAEQKAKGQAYDEMAAAIESPTNNPNFRKWFEGSKVVDEDGNPLKVYHGTTHYFTEYSEKRGNIQNDFGIGFYASSSTHDVNYNYTSKGGDLRNRIYRRADELEDELSYSDEDFKLAIKLVYPDLKRINVSKYDIREIAKKLATQELNGNAENIMPVYLSIKNPLELDKNGGTTFALGYEVNEDGDIDFTEDGTADDLYNSLIKVAREYNIDGVSIWSYLSDKLDSFFEPVTAFDLVQTMKNTDEIAYLEDYDNGGLVGNQFIRDVFKDMGFDGVIYHNPLDHFHNMTMAVGTKHFIAFEPNQIKSATGNSGEFNPNSSSLIAATIRENAEKYGQPNLAPTFYSQMEKIVNEKLANKITPAELIKNIDSWASKGLIKADEVKWSGIKDWLEVIQENNTILKDMSEEEKQQWGNPNIIEKLSKEDVLKQLKESQIKITEVEKNTEKADKEEEELYKNKQELQNSLFKLRQDLITKLVPYYESRETTLVNMVEAFQDEIVLDIKNPFSKEQLDEFRENLSKAKLVDDFTNYIHEAYKYHRLEKEHDDFLRDYKTKKTRWDTYKVRGGTNYTELLFTMPERVDFNSEPHWIEDGVIAHTRFTDRVDHEGKKVLFLEEVQSDIHQKGRKYGYKNREEVERLNKEYEVLKKEYDTEQAKWDKVNNEINDLYRKNDKLLHTPEIEDLLYKLTHAITTTNYARYREKYEEAKNIRLESKEIKENDRLIADLNNKADLIENKMKAIQSKLDINYDDRKKVNQGVSEAPFSKNWHEFILKRMIRYAAENNYDKIAWATGEQNTTHYEDYLRKAIDEIEYNDLGNGDYEVSAYKDSEYVLDSNVYDKKKLEETFGEAIADKIINNKGETYKNGGVLKGLDITIGGEGMKGFYDKMIPDFLNKYLKKWGAKVGETVIGGEVDNKNLTYEEIARLSKENPVMGHTVQQAIEITPAMRNDVLLNGQPLFERGEAYGNGDRAKALEEINSAYDEMASANEESKDNKDDKEKEDILSEIKKYEDDIVNGKIPQNLVLDVLNKIHELRNKLEKVQGTKERKHFETYQNSEATDNRTKLELAKKDSSYIPITNKETWEKALERVYKNYDLEVAYIRNLKGGFTSALDTAVAEAILYKMQEEKRFTEASIWASEVAEKATAAGQAVQALAIWSKLSPEGILRNAVHEFSKVTTKGEEERVKNKTKEIKDKVDKANEDVLNKLGNELDRLIKKKGIKATASKVKKDIEEITPKEAEPEDTTESIIDRVINSSEKLANKVSTHAEQREAIRKMDNPSEDMIKTLYEVARDVLPEKEKPNPKNPIEFITKALQNKNEYREVWKKAQEIVKERFKDNKEALASLDNYFNKYLDTPFSEKKMDKAIKMDLKELKIDLKEVVRKHFLETTKVTKTLQERLIDKGLSEEDSKFLADYIEKRMEKLTKIAKESILNRMIGKPKTKKQKNLYEKIIELSNLGALESEKYRSYVASKMGVPVLTEDVAKDLVERANYIQTMEGGEAKTIEIFKMLDKIAAQIPATKLEKINAYHTIFQLLSFKTWARNVIGNSGFAKVDRYFTYLPLKIIDTLMWFKTHETTVARPMPIVYTKAWWKGLGKGIKYAKMGMPADFMENNKLQLPRTTFRKENLKGIEKVLRPDVWEKLLRISLQAFDTAYKQATFTESMAQQMKLKKVSEPTQDMIDKASFIANYRTFNADTNLSEKFAEGKKMLNQFSYRMFGGSKEKTAAWGLGDVVIKYPKVPANMINIGFVDYTPLGVVKAFLQLRREIKDTNKFDQNNFAMALSRATVGTSILAFAVQLALLGLLTGRGDDDEDLRNVEEDTGFGQYRINISGILRYVTSGFDKEAALKQEGDITVNYDWFQPLGLALALGSDAANSKKITGGSLASSIVEALSSGVNTVVEQPLMTGIRNLASSKDKFKGLVDAVSGIPSSFVPAIVNQSKQLVDNSSRDTAADNSKEGMVNKLLNSSMANKVKARLPFVSDTLAPRVNTFGHEKETYPEGSNTLFNVFLNPAYVRKYKPTQEQKLVLDIYKDSGSKVQVPRVVDRTIPLNGEKVQLTPAEYEDYQQRVGEMAEFELSKIPAVAIDSEKQAEQIQSILTKINNKVKNEILIEKGYNPKSKKKPSEY